jgi:hypothetical protein
MARIQYQATLKLSIAAAFCILALGAACQDGDEPGEGETDRAATAEAFSTADPWVYCAEVGTIDAPDERYVGEPVPQAIAEGIRDATGGAADAPLDFFTRGTFWRCVDEDVYACTVGANLPCEAKADTSETPPAAMTEFCQANPDSDFIPAAVTGRETVYEWVCDGEVAVASRQVWQVDGRGFIADIWYRLESPQ